MRGGSFQPSRRPGFFPTVYLKKPSRFRVKLQDCRVPYVSSISRPVIPRRLDLGIFLWPSAAEIFHHKHAVRTITDSQPSIADNGNGLYV